MRQPAHRKEKPPPIHQGTAAEVVQEYSESTALYVSDDDLPELARRASENRLELSVREDFDVLQLPNGFIDARRGTEASLPGKRLGPPAQAGTSGLYLVQFSGPVLKTWTEAVALADVKFIQYIPMNGYIVAARPESMAHVARLPFVQFVDVFHASLKSQAVTRTKGLRSELLISVANVFDLGRTLRNLERLSTTELMTEVVGEEREEVRVRGTFDGEDVDAVVAERLVIAVSPVPRMEISDERVAMSLGPHTDSQGNVLTAGGRYKAWLEGICPACATLKQDGFYAAIGDTGFWAGPKNASNENDAGPSELPNDHGGTSGRVSYGMDYWESPPKTAATATATSFDDESNAVVGGGHGTFVASVIAGNPSSGTDTAGFLCGMGVAPSAGLKISKLNYQTLTSISTLAHDARVSTSPAVYVLNYSTNEYAQATDQCVNTDGKYSLVSRQFDEAVRDSNANATDGVTPILIVVSAGNHHQSVANASCQVTAFPKPRNLTVPPATAKNVLAVGATETPRTATEQWNCRLTAAGSDGLQNVEFDSRRGTADAGWFKPDLMAPAANVAGLRDDSTTQTGLCAPYNTSSTLPPTAYAAACGTSFSAPVGTGAALLASRAFSATAGSASPALLKAMLVMSARSMKGGKDHADRTQEGFRVTPPTTIGAIPSQSQGFGRISLEKILDAYPARSYFNEGQTLAAVNDTWSNTYKVHDATRPVIIVLTWTDVPAQISTGQFSTNPIVNDLDLTVYQGATCAQRYLGNHLNATTEESLAVACTGPGPFAFDRKNNVEYVRFSGAAADSSFTVTVEFETATGTGSGSNQKFALAVWNAYDADDGAPPAAPTGVSATATSSTAITVSWNAVSGATGYDVRMWQGGPFWNTISTNQCSAPGCGTAERHSLTRSGLTPLTSYLFDVRARNVSGVSVPSAADGATTFRSGTTTLFTDDPATAGMIVKTSHVTELRDAVNAFRANAGLPTMTFTDATLSAGVTAIRLPHIKELRDGLNAARSALNLPALTYTDTDLTSIVVKAVHIQELRNALK